MEYEITHSPAPAALGFIAGKDVRIISIGCDFILFESDALIDDDFTLELSLFDYRVYDYRDFKISGCRVCRLDEKEFSYIYRSRPGKFLSAGQEAYRTLVKELAAVVHAAKNDTGSLNDISFLKENYNVYPVEKDGTFFDSYTAQQKMWFTHKLTPKEIEHFKKIAARIEPAFFINDFILYKRFVNEDSIAFFDKNLRDIGIAGHPLFEIGFKRLYIGSEFCFNLFPRVKLLTKMLNKTSLGGYEVTLAFPLLRDDMIEQNKEILNFLNRWVQENGKRVEVIFNDWGMLYLVYHHYPNLTPVLGRLLNKRQKDPKKNWKLASGKYFPEKEENYLNFDRFRQFLERYGVTRFEFESHQGENRIPGGRHSLHFPYFQMNTSQFCPLYAECVTLNRAKQNIEKRCPYYCSEFAIMYPVHLRMIGRGNTIFGFDNRVLVDPLYLESYVAVGIDRLVFSL